MRHRRGVTTQAEAFYQDALKRLLASGVPFMIGEGYAMREYAGIFRDPKDLDIFCVKADYRKLLEVPRQAGYTPKLEDPRWIAKAFHRESYVDLIFNSGKGLCPVDETWLDFAPTAELLGCTVQLVPAEELIWSKAYVQHRERFDGADIVHLIRQQGRELNWERLLARMEAYWEVLLGHVLQFRFVYPGERDTVPRWLMAELLERARQQLEAPPPRERVWRGTLLARPHYEVAVTEWGYTDARALVGQGDGTGEAAEGWAQTPRRGARRPPRPRDLSRAVSGVAG